MRPTSKGESAEEVDDGIGVGHFRGHLSDMIACTSHQMGHDGQDGRLSLVRITRHIGVDLVDCEAVL